MMQYVFFNLWFYKHLVCSFKDVLDSRYNIFIMVLLINIFLLSFKIGVKFKEIDISVIIFLLTNNAMYF